MYRLLLKKYPDKTHSFHYDGFTTYQWAFSPCGMSYLYTSQNFLLSTFSFHIKLISSGIKIIKLNFELRSQYIHSSKESQLYLRSAEIDHQTMTDFPKNRYLVLLKYQNQNTLFLLHEFCLLTCLFYRIIK